MPTLNIFSTPIWNSKIENHASIDAEILAYVEKQRSTESPGQNLTNVGGWHSNNLDFSQLPLFRKMLHEFTNQIARELDIREGHSPVMDNCWANVNYHGSYNRTHTHPNCMISGIYYACVPQNSGDVVFMDPRPQAMCLLPPVKEHNRLTSWEMRTTPHAGLILAFPSWLPHYVDSSKAEEERISIAFNFNFLPTKQ